MPFSSHPAWVRGLKLFVTFNPFTYYCVAPRVGAWIETLNSMEYYDQEVVAPRVGAWIETELRPEI